MLNPVNFIRDTGQLKILLGFLAIAFGFAQRIGSSKDADEIKQLPGLTFDYPAKQYAGYLQLSSQNNLHYWLLESQNRPSTDPLIIWISGGPGCSSLFASFTELGPFFLNPDGKTLFENAYSWNKISNMLFFDNPTNVGFSYSASGVDNSSRYNDDNTAEDNAEALQLFLARFPEYKGRDFYVMGESYAGIHVAVLTKKLIPMITANPTKLDLNLVGLAIGNGFLSIKQSLNSYVNMAFYRGMIGKEDFDLFKTDCCVGVHPIQDCDFSAYIDVSEHGKLSAKKSDQPAFNKCALKILAIVKDQFYGIKGYDEYDINSDCYASPDQFKQDSNFWRTQSYFEALNVKSSKPLISDGLYRFVDQGSLINTKSTDPLGGFNCYVTEATEKYFDLLEVRKALKIPALLDNTQLKLCKQLLNENYKIQYPETGALFQWIFDSGYPLNILIFNGDTDGVCNFLDDSLFVRSLNMTQYTFGNRTAWTYQKDNFKPMIVGYHEKFYKNTVKLDLLTLSSAGHMVPRSLPGPSLQMIANFMSDGRDYSKALPFSPTAQKISAVSQAFSLSRKEADRVFTLPGQTFRTYFKQYSGYLNADKGNYLHYWLVESESNPTTDPLVLWFNGGPGCSSLEGLLIEQGPFHPNPDGKTLFENNFSWNKAANMLYLESPRNVGFSYQNTTLNPDPSYDNEKTLWDAFLALKDFYSVFPEYLNRPFYVTGESFGGVYVPMLAQLLIQKIQAKELTGVNLQGMVIGNGALSRKHIINSIIPLKYHRGFIGKREWDNLAECCPEVTYQNLATCNFAKYVQLEEKSVKLLPADDSVCAARIVAIAQHTRWSNHKNLDVNNIYQDCYEETEEKVNIPGSALFEAKKKTGALENDLFNTYSTDSQGGFSCFRKPKTETWLNIPSVRTALNIPSYIPAFQVCNKHIVETYQHGINDTSSFFDNIIRSKYPMKVLIYNGDLDFACNFLSAQWFVEELAQRNGLKVSKAHAEWIYRSNIAGYVKQFQGANITVDLLTIKGGGHFAPHDRPGPSLQMLTNFLANREYSVPIPFRTDMKPLNREYNKKQEMTPNMAFNPKNAKQMAASKFTTSFNRLQQAHSEKFGNNWKGYLANYTSNHNADTILTRKIARKSTSPPPTTTKTQDKVIDLPGLTFPMSDQYSGYLNASMGVFLHYWLVTSQSNPTTDPIVLWLNGGPGSSSLMGLFTELGPFKPSKDGKKLHQNSFAWTKFANVLFLESPRGVGFSYSTDESEIDPDQPYNDDLAASNNVLAVLSFFDRFPEYKSRPFYITGESYGGIYVPTLVNQLLKTIKIQNIDSINLVGVAIGNGLLNYYNQLNSAIYLEYFRGFYDYDTFKSLSKCCPQESAASIAKSGYVAPCDFSQYLEYDQIKTGNPRKDPDNPNVEECGRLTIKLGLDLVWGTGHKYKNSGYNTYQDCYSSEYSYETEELAQAFKHRSRQKRDATDSIESPVLTNIYSFVDQAKLVNQDSTDSFQSAPCYLDDATEIYLRDPEVLKSIHVDIAGLPQYQQFNRKFFNTYKTIYLDTTPVFKEILGQVSLEKPLKFLIYNGDADMVCQFLGDQWFVEKLAGELKMEEIGTRKEWNFTQPSKEFTFLPRLAGFNQMFRHENGQATFNLATVKGAGHLVPLDRPGPMFQLMYNFINNCDLSETIDPSLIAPIPLLDTQQVTYSKPLKRTQDRIWDLPGLSFTPKFAQYSGYVKGNVKGNYMFYWLVEPQYDQRNAPVLLWLSGGPGCSGSGALLTENGPFLVNPDGRTLFENVFSWNKAAYVIYLDSPRGVGFSYQNQTENSDNNEWNDPLSAADIVSAIKQIYQIYPVLSERRFYLTGESYAGVYVPTVASQLIKELEKGEHGPFSGLGINLRGIAIGNGFFSFKWIFSTVFDLAYFRGLISKDIWDEIRKCCQPLNELYCHIPEDSDCDLLKDGFMERFLAIRNHIDSFNIYRQCYQRQNSDDQDATNVQKATSFSKKLDLKQHFLKFAKRDSFVNKMADLQTSPAESLLFSKQILLNYGSNDASFGFPCYALNSVEKYLSQAHVRESLHVPDFVQKWKFCNDTINQKYDHTYFDAAKDMGETFKEILSSNYVLENTEEPFRILAYNGDSDLVCSFLEAEFFLEQLVEEQKTKSIGKKTAAKHPWYYSQTPNISVVAGFHKSYSFSSSSSNAVVASLDFLTVKGAGHFAAVDRSGPTLQMISNFVGKNINYSQPLKYPLMRSHLKSQYEPNPASQNSPNRGSVPALSSASPPSPLTTTQDSTTLTSGAQKSKDCFLIRLICFFLIVNLF